MGLLTGRKVGPPQGSSKPGELEKRFIRDYSKSKATFSVDREVWKRFFRAYAGNPFDEGVKEALNSQDRILTSFNYCLSTINTLIGQDQADRKEARFEGVDGNFGDSFLGELFTDLVRHLYQKAKGHRKESDAQLDQLITGYGWIEVYMDSTSFPFSLKVRHADVFDIYVDPNYRESNCADARYIIHTKSWPLEEAIARWPQHEDALYSAVAAGSDDRGPHPRVARGDNYGYGPGPNDTNYRAEEGEELVQVSDYQYKKLAPWVAFQDPNTGEERELPAADFKELMKELALEVNPETGETLAEGIGESVEFQREEIYRCWFAGLETTTCLLLEGPKIIEDGMFTYRCATGYRARREENGLAMHFGLMALIYEPQLWSAKALSSMLDMIAVQMKGGGFYNPQALLDPAKFQNDAGIPGKWHALALNANPQLDIIPNQPVQFPAAYERIMDIAVSAPQKTANISDYDKGTAQSERSNVLISNLQQHSQMVLNPLMDPLSEMRVGVALLFAKFAQRYIPAKLIDRILGDKKCEGITFEYELDEMGFQQEVPIMVPDPKVPVDPMTGQGGQRPIRPSDLIRNADVTDFDVAIDLGSASVTSKQAFMQTLMQTAFAQTLADLGVLDRFLPLMVKNWPGLPANDAKKLSRELEADSAAKRAQQNAGAILQAIQAMPPDQQMALAQQLAPMLQQVQAQQQAPPAEGQAPPAEPQVIEGGAPQ